MSFMERICSVLYGISKCGRSLIFNLIKITMVRSNQLQIYLAICRVNPDIRKDEFLSDIRGKKISLLKMFLSSFNVAKHSSSTLRSFLKFWDLS